MGGLDHMNGCSRINPGAENPFQTGAIRPNQAHTGVALLSGIRLGPVPVPFAVTACKVTLAFANVGFSYSRFIFPSGRVDPDRP